MGENGCFVAALPSLYQLAEKFGTLGVLYEINVSAGLSEQFQRGPQVLGAVVRALMRDVP